MNKLFALLCSLYITGCASTGKAPVNEIVRLPDSQTDSVDGSLTPLIIGKLSNGSEVVLQFKVATPKKYFPVVDWLAPVAEQKDIVTQADSTHALVLLAKHPEYDQRYLNGSMLLKQQLKDNAGSFIDLLNQRLIRLVGPKEFANLNGPFQISATFDINPYGGIGQCAQYWETLVMGFSAAYHAPFSITTVSPCDSEVPTPGSPQGLSHWDDSLSQFANEPYSFVVKGAQAMKQF